MIKVTEHTTISRTPEEVFSFACDYRRDPLWRTGVREMRLVPEGAPSLGTVTVETMDFMGRSMITKAAVTRYEPGRTIAFRSINAPVPVEGFRVVEPTPQGTRFTYHLESKPRGASRLLSPLMKSLFRRQMQKDLQKLKDLIEAGA